MKASYDQIFAEQILAEHGEYLLQLLREQPVRDAGKASYDLGIWIENHKGA